MKKDKLSVVVAHGHSSIEVFHSLTPLIFLANESNELEFKFVDYIFNSLNKLEGDVLILVRKFHKLDIRNKQNIDIMINELKILKKNFSKIIYFDDSAAISHILFFIIPFVDAYWVRGLLNDLKNYSKNFYGGRTYSQFYHDNYGIIDDQSYLSPVHEGDFPKKIKIAWNIGIGMYPSPSSSLISTNYNKVKKISCILSSLPSIKAVYFILKKYKKEMIDMLSKPIDLSRKKALISSRFSYKGYYNSISFHRKLLLAKIKDNKLFMTGRLPHKKYIDECCEIYGLLSPFGWGEICYRDYEAIMCGNILIKPDMSHLSTWPNIYGDDCYLKLDWDFMNLDKICELFLQKNKVLKYVESSRDIYLSALNECSARAEKMILDEI
tara:strand:- start:706 stop:1848 length:1143 start_codon:yes stop_codon:yes gene_type:complete